MFDRTSKGCSVQVLRSYLILFVAVFCLYANLLSMLFTEIFVIYLRDLLIFFFVFLLFGKNASPAQKVILIAWLFLVVCYIILCHGNYGSISKIRNYVMFPFMVFAFAECTRPWIFESGFKGNRVDRIFYFFLDAYVLLFFIEALIYTFLPSSQDVLYGLLRDISDEKGTSVGLSGGIFSGLRIITPAGNPVQGSFVLFTWWLLRLNGFRTVLYFLAHVLSVSKVTLVLGIVGFFLKSKWFSALIILFVSMVLAGYFVLPSIGNVHVDSVRMHIEGFVYGFTSIFSSPLGIEFDTVSAQSKQVGASVAPGFESYLGSIWAAFGIPGFILSVAIFATAYLKSRLVGFLIFAFAFSDNTSSPHLFIAVFFLAWSRWHLTFEDHRSSCFLENNVVPRLRG